MAGGLDTPTSVRRVKSMEKEFGKPPNRGFSRAFNGIMANLRTEPDEAVRKALKAQNLVPLLLSNKRNGRKTSRKVRRKFKALKYYIRQFRPAKAEKVWNEIRDILKDKVALRRVY